MKIKNLFIVLCRNPRGKSKNWNTLTIGGAIAASNTYEGAIKLAAEYIGNYEEDYNVMIAESVLTRMIKPELRHGKRIKRLPKSK